MHVIKAPIQIILIPASVFPKTPLPDGSLEPLITISDWDFRWQEIYRFPHPVKVVKGSVIHIEGTYDNTADNPANPNNPPKNVFSMGDMKTTDEMMTLIMGFLPYMEGDEKIDLK